MTDEMKILINALNEIAQYEDEDSGNSEIAKEALAAVGHPYKEPEPPPSLVGCQTESQYLFSQSLKAFSTAIYKSIYSEPLIYRKNPTLQLIPISVWDKKLNDESETK